MFHSVELCGAKTTWKTVGEIAHNCTELKIVNMSRTKGEILEYPLIQATNIVELQLSETLINDQLFVLKSKSIPKLDILNVSRCYNLTNLAIEKSSFPSWRFLGIAYRCSASRQLFVPSTSIFGNCSLNTFSLVLLQITKESNILYIILVQYFCPLKIKITEFPDGFHLNST